MNPLSKRPHITSGTASDIAFCVSEGRLESDIPSLLDTLLIWESTITVFFPNPYLRTHAAVLSPTPGRLVRPSRSSGTFPPNSSMMVRVADIMQQAF